VKVKIIDRIILESQFLYRVGRCPKCMRQSFLAMAAAWIALLLALSTKSLLNSVALIDSTAIGAILFTLLWSIHVFTYAARKKSRLSSEIPIDAVDFSRRRLFKTTAYSFGAAAISVAVATAFPKLARADVYQCGNTTCDQGTICCTNNYNGNSYCCEAGTSCDGSGTCTPPQN
jgi:hypothetical protein